MRPDVGQRAPARGSTAHRAQTTGSTDRGASPSQASDALADAPTAGDFASRIQSEFADRDQHGADLGRLFEQLEAGKLKLDSQLKVSEEAADQSPTKLGLRTGSTISVEDAIKGIVTKSANDAAVVVAENLGGDEDGFAKMMTQKARALGMTRTTYVNSSGLPDDDQLTTARDQALLGRAIALMLGSHGFAVGVHYSRSREAAGLVRVAAKSNRYDTRSVLPCAMCWTARSNSSLNSGGPYSPSAVRPCTTAPPTSGPEATDRPVIALKMPIAAPRRSGGNAALSNARPSGMISAAPAPCSARPAVSKPALGAGADPTEASVNRPSPVAYRFLRP